MEYSTNTTSIDVVDAGVEGGRRCQHKDEEEVEEEGSENKREEERVSSNSALAMVAQRRFKVQLRWLTDLDVTRQRRNRSKEGRRRSGRTTATLSGTHTRNPRLDLLDQPI